MKRVHVIGKISDIKECQQLFPSLSYSDIELILNSRKFTRWYKHNAKIINVIALITPSLVLTSMGTLFPGTVLFEFMNPTVAVAAAVKGSTVPVSFWGGKGAILLHMLVVGFFTLVVSSFLKFTGRADFIPLVAFVGGGVILYEVIGLFNDIYGAVKTLLSV